MVYWLVFQYCHKIPDMGKLRKKWAVLTHGCRDVVILRQEGEAEQNSPVLVMKKKDRYQHYEAFSFLF